MSSSVELGDRGELLQLPAARPLDEAAWRAWQERNRLRDPRSNVVHRRAMMWISMAALLATVGLWGHAEQYQVVIRFAVALCATGALFAAVHTRHFAFAFVFAAMVLLYNPLAPTFDLSGNWQRLVVVASVIPFATSLSWLKGIALIPSAVTQPRVG